MFTGLIEALGEVAEVKPTPAGFRLRLTTPIAAEILPGDSLSVNGVCLTGCRATRPAFMPTFRPKPRG